MKKCMICVIVMICIIVTISSCDSADITSSNSSDEDTSIVVEISDDSRVASEQPGVIDLPWEIPEDIENPSQGLELSLTYTKEQGDVYVVTGIGTCEDTDLVIPSTVDGVPVVEIESRAFYGNKQIQSLYCGNRVTKIGDYAFGAASNLKKIIIPDSVVSIGDEAFCNSGVADLEIGDRVQEFGEGVFQMCGSLRSVKLPYCLTVLSENTFNFCSALTEVELSPNTVSIEKQAFEGAGLKSIKFPASVKTVAPNSFSAKVGFQGFEVDEENPYLCSVDGVLFSKDMAELIIVPKGKNGSYTVPNGVKIIDEMAFMDITYEVTLPDSVRTISESAFYGRYRGNYTLNIKKGLTFIDNFAFSSSEGRVTINFEGTKEEWNAIRKPEYWYQSYGGAGNQTITVNCSDGTLTFNYDPGY